MIKKLYIKVLSYLLRLDCATLKTDSKIVKIIKKIILRPIGFYFRKKHFEIVYK